jgi:hypothetical protein
LDCTLSDAYDKALEYSEQCLAVAIAWIALVLLAVRDALWCYFVGLNATTHISSNVNVDVVRIGVNYPFNWYEFLPVDWPRQQILQGKH